MDATKTVDQDEHPKSKEQDLSRRGFMYGVGGIVATLAVGGVAKAAEGGDMLYPPGAQDRAVFNALCIRCDRCRSACTQNAIGVGKLEDGLTNARVPKMEFRLSYCNECDGQYKCIEACPTGALSSFDPAKDKIGMAVIDTDKCQVFGTSASCGKSCLRACPVQAIKELDNGWIEVDEDLCWGCGACELVCPTNAYRSYDGNTARGINIQVWRGNAQ